MIVLTRYHCWLICRIWLNSRTECYRSRMLSQGAVASLMLSHGHLLFACRSNVLKPPTNQISSLYSLLGHLKFGLGRRQPCPWAAQSLRVSHLGRGTAMCTWLMRWVMPFRQSCFCWTLPAGGFPLRAGPCVPAEESNPWGSVEVRGGAWYRSCLPCGHICLWHRQWALAPVSPWTERQGTGGGFHRPGNDIWSGSGRDACLGSQRH